MKITPYGMKEAAVGVLLMALLAAAVIVTGFLVDFPWIGIASAVFLAGAVFVLYFFRDPERTAPGGEETIVSPADGVVTHVEDVDAPPYLDGPARKVSIFMSLMNVHVNRAPLSGKVEYLKHNPGKFLNAGYEEALEANENCVVGFQNHRGRFIVKQIAGVVARRIVCGVSEGDELVRGERFGMIKFGSRLEVFVPKDTPCEFKVSPGDKVRAGETIIGELAK